MHFRRSAAALLIALAGIALCAGNLWFAARRSTIPVALDAVLVDKDIGHEKHPGIDDVHWLTLDDGKTIHVDKDVFDLVHEGERMRKESWSRQLHHGGRVHHLKWSADVHGMVRVMAVGVGLIAVMIVLIFRSPANSWFLKGV